MCFGGKYGLKLIVPTLCISCSSCSVLVNMLQLVHIPLCKGGLEGATKLFHNGVVVCKHIIVYSDTFKKKSSLLFPPFFLS